MTDETTEAVRAAFEGHDAFESADGGYRVATTPFDARVSARPAGEWKTAFSVAVDVPTLDAAVAGEVGTAVADGWLDAFERRLEGAPSATRAAVELSSFAVSAEDGTVTVEYWFEFGDERRGVEIAKTFVEFVEGTYVQGVVPGYDYESPVADLLSEATDGEGEGERGGTPL
ncbi:MAG: DUF5813 family protein [Haloarculaceae archaeon]